MPRPILERHPSIQDAWRGFLRGRMTAGFQTSRSPFSRYRQLGEVLLGQVHSDDPELTIAIRDLVRAAESASRVVELTWDAWSAGQDAVGETDPAKRHQSIAAAMRGLWFEHLAAGELRDLSSRFHGVAIELLAAVPVDDPDLTIAIRDLVRAKDSAVRAKVFDMIGSGQPKPVNVTNPDGSLKSG